MPEYTRSTPDRLDQAINEALRAGNRHSAIKELGLLDKELGMFIRRSENVEWDAMAPQAAAGWLDSAARTDWRGVMA